MLVFIYVKEAQNTKNNFFQFERMFNFKKRLTSRYHFYLHYLLSNGKLKKDV